MAPNGIVGSPTHSKVATRHEEKDLAYRLFIELLAYQLASPVRWIETQNELLRRPSPVQRFIEIGPRSTLTRMARKSASIHHDRHTPSQWSHLQFISYQDDRNRILYEYPDPVRLPSTIQRTTSASTSTQLAVAVEGSRSDGESESVAASLAFTPIKTSAHVPSAKVSLSARHILLAITGQKLRCSFDQVPMDTTIRNLSGGKSTLQNELIGDLVAEFGRVPESMEDMSLANLVEALQGRFSGKPGKQMSALISRFISSKMPAGFNQRSAQMYMHSKWGLEGPDGMIPICLAITVQPSSRLADAGAAHAYLDNLVGQYAEFEGITMLPTQRRLDNENGYSEPTPIDAVVLSELRKEQQNLQHRQLKLLADYLKIKPGDLEDSAQSVDHISDLQDSLDQWNAEFGEEFLQGVRPSFNLQQVRHYDSSWNWVREDLLKWIYAISQGSKDAVLSEKGGRLRRILNRWDPGCTDIILHRLEMSTSTACEMKGHVVMLNQVLKLGIRAQATDPVHIHTLAPLMPSISIRSSGRLEYTETSRSVCSYADVIRRGYLSRTGTKAPTPFVHIRTRNVDEDWTYDAKATEMLHQVMDGGLTTGFSYVGKTVLVTGAGPGSIAVEIIQGLLAGGARVLVTTSRTISTTARFYQSLFRKYGARGASLTLLPMNQASRQDCEAIIGHIYGAEASAGNDVDCIIPFAAIPQTGEPDTLGSRQELALRGMLVNLLRLVGHVCREKEKRRINTRPTMVILPLSCNEGTFGGDGLYAEAKIGLKSLFNRFHSESWSTYATICGAVMGWTRGTGLMHSSDMIAAEMEKLGVITFSRAEMAFNILALLSPAITALAEETPVYADLTGGFGAMWNLKEHIAASRKAVAENLRLGVVLAEEEIHHEAALHGQQANSHAQEPEVRNKRANLNIGFPSIARQEDMMARLPDLQGMIDLSQTVVIVGFSELGPWGSSRTRWEMESQGQFSLEGYVEMAWMMGLIRHITGDLKGQPYVGWIDVVTSEPISDDEIPERYHQQIIENSGLRFVEPDALNTYDPSRIEFMHEVAIEDDLPPFESSKSAAEAFKLRHGDHVFVQPILNSDNYRVFMKKGAVVMVPKAIPFHPLVGGRVPKGWDPLRYGIPGDIVQEADPTTLYALCCVSEAFLSAGIQDPYQMYQYIQVSEVANCLGTGGGPMKTIQSMYRDRYLDRPVQGDIILDHFSNTMGAWVNMLLLSSSGPLRTHVGACATAIESLDSGCEAIKSGKCKVAIVGGCDDFGEEVAYEFAGIKATANTKEELAKGRLPGEFSRPTTSSRSGFAESAGCGVQIVVAADLALEMGLPIYGIVAYTQMASDQIGRSIPAPGKGILTAARESADARHSPLLDLEIRRAGFEREVAEIRQQAWDGQVSSTFQTESTICATEERMKSRLRDAQNRWANSIRVQDASISPLRASLATWALSIDDIGVVSSHGTSTRANELNEGEVINTQMNHLGRRRGNPLLCVCQKSVTGHPKAAAGAWQLNGCIQMFRDSIVPGNRNADNIDEQLRQFKHLVYPMDSMKVPDMKAIMLTSFGFGQKGALAVVVTPRYVFAAVPTATFEDYRTRALQRQRTANVEFVTRLLKNSLVQVKCDPPWKSAETMQSVFLDPDSRLAADDSFGAETPVKAPSPDSVGERSDVTAALVQSLLERVTRRSGATTPTSVGVDVEEIMSLHIENLNFLQRNFTPAERDYCSKAANPRSAFAGRWSAKEAVFKSFRVPSMGAGAAMQNIEILEESGNPYVKLHGHAHAVAMSKGISKIELAIGHSGEVAAAVALARWA
ncbi:putative PKS/NRPS-like protein biosynthetic cluster [Aspergillus tubingensis]|nr:putative PKS/NRPS-like protein biosynthetic cluster [Aspergillus tubingensis]